jgi:hypothetical protein
MGFNPERILTSCKMRTQPAASPRHEWTFFFTVKANPNAAKIAAKRKAEKAAAANSKKKSKVGKKR